jgi:hypothetical protein
MSLVLTRKRLKAGLLFLFVTQFGTACGRTEGADPRQDGSDGTGGCSALEPSCVTPPDCPWGTPNPIGTGCWIVEGCGSPSAMCDPSCPGYNPCACSGPGSDACDSAPSAGGSAPISLDEKLANCGPLPEPNPNSPGQGLGGMGGDFDRGIVCGEECTFCNSSADCCSSGATTYCLDNRCISQ